MQGKAALQVFGLEAQFAHKVGEGLELAGIGGTVNAAQEMQPLVGKHLGDRFVGGEHELLDDLVAFGVLPRDGPRDTLPSLSRSISSSGIDNSSEPRCIRRPRSIIASSCIRPSRAWTSGVSFDFQPGAIGQKTRRLPRR